jgi:formate hydrogenlyase transcriptional activator
MKIEPPKTDEITLRKRLQFEEMLSDLSARFLAIPFDQVDREIGKALRRIREFFQVDRCALLEFLKDKACARITHAAYSQDDGQVSGDVNLAEMFPWCYEQLLTGQTINISRVEDYPADALRDRASYYLQGFSCFQAVASVFASDCGLERETLPRMISPFGGGIAETTRLEGTLS